MASPVQVRRSPYKRCLVRIARPPANIYLARFSLLRALAIGGAIGWGSLILSLPIGPFMQASLRAMGVNGGAFTSDS